MIGPSLSAFPASGALARSHAPRLADFGVLLAAGLFFSFSAPFETGFAPWTQRAAYWIGVMVLGGALLLAADGALARLIAKPIARAGASLVLATPLQTAMVMGAGALLLGLPLSLRAYVGLLPLVALVSLAALGVLGAVRLALRRRARPAADERRDALSPVPSGLASRLPAKLRNADLIALQAEDHYVRVHTRAGSGLVLMRMRDAVAMVADRPGFRLHRSWWASEAAIGRVRFRRGSGEAALSGDITAPVSRSCHPALRKAGLA